MLSNKEKSGVFAPSYYENFRCKAQECRHSCCINWEICIDDATLAKYREIGGELQSSVTECEDGACFRLSADGRCPHLNETGLCNIIISHGEDFLSDICRLHPRFFNELGGGRTELGLGIVCEEACRLVLENEKPFSLQKTELPKGTMLEFTGQCEAPANSFSALDERDKIISEITKSNKGSFAEKLTELRRIYEIRDIHTENEWICRFLELEILDTEWEQILKSASTLPQSTYNEHFDKYYLRLLTYFIFRHVSTAENRDKLRAKLAFSILSAEMIKLLFERENEQKLERLAELARLYSSEIEYSPENTDELIFEFESEF